MKEDFLQFVWQFQYFDTQNLRTIQGNTVEILQQGRPNPAGGPDFSLARIRIDDLEWVGNVEIHWKTSAWQQHQHHQDQQYDTVILHVVAEDDGFAQRSDKSDIPTIEIGKRIFEHVQKRYYQLLQNPQEILCARQWQKVNQITKVQMFDKTLIQRLERKSETIRKLWVALQYDWEELTYRLLAKNFGFKINAEPFMQLAERLPLKILLKHQQESLQIEALIFGQAGWLAESLSTEYYTSLKKEYEFLSKKYSLQPISKLLWQTARLRPANFPAVRLAQFSTLLSRYQSIFSIFLESSISELQEQLQVSTSKYWQTHYDFDKQSKKEGKKLGKKSLENIIINTVVPILVLYAQEKQNQAFMDKAIEHLEKIAPEKNHIIEKWQDLWQVKTAFDSQALLELFQEFCLQKRCLHCSIGQNVLQQP